MALDGYNPGDSANRRQEGPATSDRFRPETESPSEALASLAEEIARMRTELKTLLSVRVDLFRAKLRRIVFLALAGAGAGIGALVLLGVIIVQLLEGAAGGLGELFGGRLWLGRLVEGTLLLGAFGGFVLYVRGRWMQTRASILKKYGRTPSGLTAGPDRGGKNGQ